MSTAGVIAIAIVAVVVLAAVSFLTLARRSDVRGAGALSGETLSRGPRAPARRRAAIEEERTAAVAEAEGTASRGHRRSSTIDEAAGARPVDARRIPKRSACRGGSSSTAPRSR